MQSRLDLRPTTTTLSNPAKIDDLSCERRGEEKRRERLRQELREERNESDARGERREREIIGKEKINLKLVATSYNDLLLASCQIFLDISSQIEQLFWCLKC